MQVIMVCIALAILQRSQRLPTESCQLRRVDRASCFSKSPDFENICSQSQIAGCSCTIDVRVFLAFLPGSQRHPTESCQLRRVDRASCFSKSPDFESICSLARIAGNTSKMDRLDSFSNSKKKSETSNRSLSTPESWQSWWVLNHENCTSSTFRH